jgi:hypothetical protein
MIISTNNPPYSIREKCEKTFDLTGQIPVFAVGNTIYNPHKGQVDDFLIAHEHTHMLQQEDSPEMWWNQYLDDKEFRLKQEIEAYRVQYRVVKGMVKDRNIVARMLFDMASNLSSPLYGSMMPHIEALKVIKKGI